MKIWSFIKWHFKKTSVSDILWYTACGLVGSGIASNNKILILAGCLIILVILSKYVFWDVMKANYKKFQDEQNTLFSTIKNSDKNDH